MHPHNTNTSLHLHCLCVTPRCKTGRSCCSYWRHCRGSCRQQKSIAAPCSGCNMTNAHVNQINMQAIGLFLALLTALLINELSQKVATEERALNLLNARILWLWRASAAKIATCTHHSNDNCGDKSENQQRFRNQTKTTANTSYLKGAAFTRPLSL